LAQHPNPYVAEAAARLIDKKEGPAPGVNDRDGTMVSLVKKTRKLKGIEMFGDLLISELAALASVTQELTVNGGRQELSEDDGGETLYLVLEGDVSVVADKAGQEEIELNRIRAGEYFGEMAIFQDDHDPIAVRAPNGARLLTLSKEAFHKIVIEHPEIGLYACRVLTRRIRRLHTKIKQSDVQVKNAGE